MSFLDNYAFRANSGKAHTAHAVDDRVFIVHKFGASAKVYKPNDEQYHYYFMGYYPTDYFVGKEQIERLIERVEKDDTIKDEKIIIVLCASGKDAMTATELGFMAISLNSETSTFVPNYVINAVDDMCKILNKAVEVKIVYDLDQTAETMAYEISKKLDKRFTKASVVKLPQKLADVGGKDISDWMALGLDKEELITIIGGEDYNADAHKSIDEKCFLLSSL